MSRNAPLHCCVTTQITAAQETSEILYYINFVFKYQMCFFSFKPDNDNAANYRAKMALHTSATLGVLRYIMHMRRPSQILSILYHIYTFFVSRHNVP